MIMLSVTIAVAALASAPQSTPSYDPGGFARALWLVQTSGSPSAADPVADRITKVRVAAALDAKGGFDVQRAADLFPNSTLQQLAGGDGVLDATEIRLALDAALPGSRAALNQRVRAHMDLLSTSFDLIDPARHASIIEVSDWIAANHRRGQPLHVVTVCTGNSRRSILGSTLGNIAASYSGLPEIHFHSGGTQPSAMNPRTIASLQSIGVEIKPTGDQAAPGAKGEPNPKYLLAWGDSTGTTESVEFSKRYDDPANPREGFAAIMVCSEADSQCPIVKGASLRISMPFLDPKIFDGSAFESAKYDERRDDIGRILLAILTRANYIINHK
jgi:arsenate reductase (thioredoxin)